MAYPQVSGGRTLAQINITPLVDVLLVLLVIFMIAAPTPSLRIGLDLPQASPPRPLPPPPDPIRLQIDQAGQVSWNGAVQPLAALEGLMAAEVQRHPGNQPLLQVDASAQADYGIVAQVLAAARNARMDRVGFVQAR
jgi:biopolymer transport protein ExbD